MLKKIEHPKVFISYAWTNEKYANSIFEFANRLKNNGVEVVFDKFDLDPGSEMNDFMERSVNDPSVTNVLILLNPHYKQKADSRVGGVGTETQIISPEVYSNVHNSKFIPVIFDKEGGSIQECLPVYLKARFSIDLTNPLTKETEFRNLVRRLYGYESFIEAPLGVKPAWVEMPEETADQAIQIIDNFKNARNGSQAKEAVILGFSFLSKYTTSIPLNSCTSVGTNEEKVRLYESLLPARNAYLDFLLAVSSEEEVEDNIADFFEDILKYSSQFFNERRLVKEFYSGFCHECIIYTVAILLKRKHYRAINFLLSRSYPLYNEVDKVGDFDFVFYCGKYSDFTNIFDAYYFEKNGEKKLSGFAEHLLETLYGRAVNRDEFIDADILCTNLSAAKAKRLSFWFPLTYVYSNTSFENQLLRSFAFSLKFKLLAPKIYPLFGVTSKNEMANLLKKMRSLVPEYQHFGYSNSMEEVPFLPDYITIEDLESGD